jgi:hypothetical protein
MANSFRDMVTWQLAFELKEKIIALIARSPKAKRDFNFRDQLSDACKSVPSNIAEGYGRGSAAAISARRTWDPLSDSGHAVVLRSIAGRLTCNEPNTTRVSNRKARDPTRTLVKNLREEP